MPQKRSRRGFTWIELVVIIIICGILLGLLIPAILATREKSQRANCSNNLKQIGLGMHNYHDARRQFPGSAQMVRIKCKEGDWSAGGWSFLFQIMPGDGNDLGNSINPTMIKGTITNPVTVDPLTHKDRNLQNYRNERYCCLLMCNCIYCGSE